MVRDKNVVKPARGTRQCNCKNKMVTRQLGPGMFQQYQTQACFRWLGRVDQAEVRGWGSGLTARVGVTTHCRQCQGRAVLDEYDVAILSSLLTFSVGRQTACPVRR